MNRLFVVASLFTLGLFAGLLVLGYFAYVIESGPPQSVELAELATDVRVGWTASNIATITAENTRDAFAGLGYAQASRRTWPMLLYRAAALGQLSSIAGEQMLEADEMAIRLGLADDARRAFDALDQSKKTLLESFANGANAALTDKRILREPDLILSGARPEPWAPWHSIAVERLFAWLGSEAADDSPVLASRPIQDALLLRSFASSSVFASIPPIDPGLYVRYVFGSSALPALLETHVTGIFGRSIDGACVVGTPFFLAGRLGSESWAFLPTSHYRMSRVDSTTSLRTERKRVSLYDGSEMLISILYDSVGVVLESTDATDLEASKGDSTLRVITWSGLGAASDATAWIDLLEMQPTRFVLFDGAGISISRPEPARAHGEAGVQRSSSFVAISEQPWTRFAVSRLDSLASFSVSFDPGTWFLDPYSTWARDTVPRLVSRLEASETAAVRDAVAYLRNWDFSFDRASIAASIFGVWAETANVHDGEWPGLSVESRSASTPEIAEPADRSARWTEYLKLTVAQLTSEFGSDMSTWRWERVNGGLLRFPILGNADPGKSRFVPTIVSGAGHPSTPLWGPAEVHSDVKPINFWEGWTTSGAQTWFARRLSTDMNVAFRGSFESGSSRSTISITDAPSERHEVTVLRPQE